jgi:ATPase subunit of ABC transporter with duplicated ATPase domains
LYAGLQVSSIQCRAEHLTKAYAGQSLFADLSFEIRKGERLVLLGPNGCGKTTLLRALVQPEDTPPDQSALDHGRVVWPGKVAWVDYSQVFSGLDLDDSVTHAVNTTPLAFYAPRRKVHQFLELMQFSELDLQKRIGALSGGQQARVTLALCLLSGAGTILLDEPTNHLDLTSAQVMERALLHFPGAVVVASHDRFFIDKIATRLLLFEGAGRTRLFEGNWTMFNTSLIH